MKRLEEEKKATLMERMKKISEEARDRAESRIAEGDDMRVIEDEADEDDMMVNEDETYEAEEPMESGECSPEEYFKAHMDPTQEMVEVYDEVDGKFYKVPAFETGVDENAKTDEEIVAEANSWKVTTGIITGIIVFIALVFWLCFTLMA